MQTNKVWLFDICYHINTQDWNKEFYGIVGAISLTKDQAIQIIMTTMKNHKNWNLTELGTILKNQNPKIMKIKQDDKLWIFNVDYTFNTKNFALQCRGIIGEIAQNKDQAINIIINMMRLCQEFEYSQINLSELISVLDRQNPIVISLDYPCGFFPTLLYC